MPNVTENSSDGGDTYHGYSVDDEDQPSNVDGLPDSDVDDELDRGYSPPERWSAGQGYGNTAFEEASGESLDQRVAQEEPERDPYDGTEDDDLGDGEVGDGEVGDGEVGDVRAGRLVDLDEGLGEDTEKDLVANDVGIDGAAASAEEAAMHVVPDEDGY